MNILTCSEISLDELRRLLADYGISISQTCEEKIPGTFWGEPEAGLVSNVLWVRPDTPVHSALHEACHYICMDETRRTTLHTNAGGDTDEENGVCYLQILLAHKFPAMGRARMWADMDAWGYSFRLGSARSWFEHDADDARLWLIDHGILDRSGELTGQRRIH